MSSKRAIALRKFHHLISPDAMNFKHFYVMVFAPVVALLAAGALSGCQKGDDGPPAFATSGVVTYEGKPVTEGFVSFLSNDGYASQAPLGAEGKFTITSQYGSGLPAATYQVCILPPPADAASYDPAAGKPPQRPNPENIPPKYRDPSTSGFEAVVTSAGPNEFKFEMQPQ